MEGNECYHFDKLAAFIKAGAVSPIQTSLDIGANVGQMTREICRLFPDSTVHAFEPVPEYFEICRASLLDLCDRVAVYPVAVTSQHEFADDSGQCPRPATLTILKARPEFGAGWEGSNQIVPDDLEFDKSIFVATGTAWAVASLDFIVQGLLAQGIEIIDLIKCDCEGAECSFLGCAAEATLQRCRYIVGEWHDFRRFSPIVNARLAVTHNVHIAVDPIDSRFGSFFAELSTARCILEPAADQIVLGLPCRCAPFSPDQGFSAWKAMTAIS